MSKGEMSISAFSRRSLLSVKALRLYDEMGLLRPERIDPSSGYRYYSERQLETARLISLLRKLDVPLAEIRKMVTRQPNEASTALAAWWQAEEEQMMIRRDFHRFIQAMVLNDPEAAAWSADEYDIAVRRVEETTYLYQSRHVHGPDLPAYIGSATSALAERAAVYGGSSGPEVVIFHGVVDLDSDGPADVCLPIASGSIALGDDLVRTEAAHWQAYITLEKHQVAFPQILQVYRALGEWIRKNDHAISGSPREIYLANFVESAHDEQICEVAFPVHLTGGHLHE